MINNVSRNRSGQIMWYYDGSNTDVLFDFSRAVKAAPHESVIRTGQHLI